MKAKYEQANREKTTLGRENKRLYDENKFLAEVNEAFANENDELREKLDQYAKIRLPRSMRSDDRPSKQRKATSKGKKVARLSDDELEDDSDSEADESEKHERDEKGARVFDFK
jgi:hypothetical protein